VPASRAAWRRAETSILSHGYAIDSRVTPPSTTKLKRSPPRTGWSTFRWPHWPTFRWPLTPARWDRRVPAPARPREPAFTRRYPAHAAPSPRRRRRSRPRLGPRLNSYLLPLQGSRGLALPPTLDPTERSWTRATPPTVHSRESRNTLNRRARCGIKVKMTTRKNVPRSQAFAMVGATPERRPAWAANVEGWLVHSAPISPSLSHAGARGHDPSPHRPHDVSSAVPQAPSDACATYYRRAPLQALVTIPPRSTRTPSHCRMQPLALHCSSRLGQRPLFLRTCPRPIIGMHFALRLGRPKPSHPNRPPRTSAGPDVGTHRERTT